jgi:hypothetical protein
MPRKSSSRSGRKNSVRSSSRSTRHRSSRGSKGSARRSASTRGSSSRGSARGASSSRSRKSNVLIMPRRENEESVRGRSSGRTSAAESRALTDHEEIQQWAEERGAHPACVRGTGSQTDIGMIRLDFPGYSGEQSLEEIEWDQWFEKFDDNNLALLVQEQTAGGEGSNFNKLVKRATADKKSSAKRRPRGAA